MLLKALLRPHGDSLRHDVPRMFGAMEFRPALGTGYKLGMKDWAPLWKAAYVSLFGSEKEPDLRTVSSLNRSLEGISPSKYDIEPFPSSELSLQNLEMELGKFSLSRKRPESAPLEALPTKNRNFDPNHCYKVDMATLSESNIASVDTQKNKSKMKTRKFALFEDILKGSPVEEQRSIMTLLHYVDESDSPGLKSIKKIKKPSESVFKKREAWGTLKGISSSISPGANDASLSLVKQLEARAKSYTTARSVLMKISDAMYACEFKNKVFSVRICTFIIVICYVYHHV